MAYTKIEKKSGWVDVINDDFDIKASELQTDGVTVLNGLKVEETLGYYTYKMGDLTIVKTHGVLSGLSADAANTMTDVASFPAGLLSGHDDTEVIGGAGIKNNGSGQNEFLNIYRDGDKLGVQTFGEQGTNLVFGIDIWFAYK
mgnify:CR=1 FL=1